VPSPTIHAHQMNWCGVPKPCINSETPVYLETYFWYSLDPSGLPRKRFFDSCFTRHGSSNRSLPRQTRRTAMSLSRQSNPYALGMIREHHDEPSCEDTER
jgi:hypothetical protein